MIKFIIIFSLFFLSSLSFAGDCTAVPNYPYKLCVESNGKVAADAEFEVFRIDKKGRRVSVASFGGGGFGGFEFSPNGMLTAMYMLDGGVSIVFLRTEILLNLKQGYDDFKTLSKHEMQYFLSIDNDGIVRYAVESGSGDSNSCPRLYHPISKKEVLPNTYKEGEYNYCVKMFNIVKL